MKTVCYIVLALCLFTTTACGPDFCRKANLTALSVAQKLSTRWDCAKTDKMYYDIINPINHTLCINNPQSQKVAAGLVCYALVEAFAALGALAIADRYECKKPLLIFKDLSQGTLICTVITVITL